MNKFHLSEKNSLTKKKRLFSWIPKEFFIKIYQIFFFQLNEDLMSHRLRWSFATKIGRKNFFCIQYAYSMAKLIEILLIQPNWTTF